MAAVCLSLYCIPQVRSKTVEPLIVYLSLYYTPVYPFDLLVMYTAVYLSCKGRDAGAFLNAIPKLPVFTIEPADFRIALRLRLGMRQLCILPGTVCACSRHPTIDPYGNHYLECAEEGHLYSRHNRLQTVGDQCAKTAGHYSSI